MATYTHEWIAEDVLLVTLSSEYRLGKDMSASNQESIAQLDKRTKPAWAIIDMCELQANLDDVIKAANEGTRAENQMLKHPMLIGAIFITGSEFLKLAARGLRSPVFGAANVFTADSVDEALKIIKEQSA